MISEIEAYYLSQEEPTKSCLLALRSLILDFDDAVTESWTHKMPMFKYNGKLFAYLWTDKKTYTPYIGIYKGIEIEHPKLILGKRNKMKIFNVNPEKDIPVKTINKILGMARKLY